jgi:hypothetical protein
MLRAQPNPHWNLQLEYTVVFIRWMSPYCNSLSVGATSGAVHEALSTYDDMTRCRPLGQCGQFDGQDGPTLTPSSMWNINTIVLWQTRQHLILESNIVAEISICLGHLMPCWVHRRVRFLWTIQSPQSRNRRLHGDTSIQAPSSGIAKPSTLYSS